MSEFFVFPYNHPEKATTEQVVGLASVYLDSRARVKELEEAFRAYGVHGAACQRRQHWAGDPAYCPCTCGFERALHGEEK